LFSNYFITKIKRNNEIYLYKNKNSWAFGIYQKKCKWWYLLYIGLPIAIVLSMTYIVTHYYLEKEQKSKKTEEN